MVFSAVANDSAFDAPLRWKYVDDLTLGEIVCKDSTNKSQLQVHLDSGVARAFPGGRAAHPENQNEEENE